MSNLYEFEIRAVCPIHSELIDVYQVSISTDDILPVEQIVEFVKRYKGKQIFQEALTLEIATGLGVHVKTVGIHSGVKVTSVAP